jgi:hypothetical protein
VAASYMELIAEKATVRATEAVCREIAGLVGEGGLISEPAQLRTYECDGPDRVPGGPGAGGAAGDDR